MPNISNSLYNIRVLEDLAAGKTYIHQLHPLVKLLTTVCYLTVVVSFGKYELSSLLPLLLYPVLIFALAELPLQPLLKRLLFMEPFIIGLGILNPFFERQPFALYGLELTLGWAAFLSLFIKYQLTVIAALLLIATTEMNKLAGALRLLKIPRLFILQFLLTFRYISLLMEEVVLIQRAYAMRAPRQKGIHISVWGSLTGQLLLRTYERAQQIYEAMCLRGFSGEYHMGGQSRIKIRDWTWLAGWILFLAAVRLYDLPEKLGLLLMGVVR
ncbi:MAG TPA: cobalt ECF transporter T component CbiQ [Desulfitobacteriaceae bacterium]|nr:cobalt ECF transporter T component CbiQ [Desulfitobacteriaceae bacterium]